jgi:hypothetical protein
MKKLLNEGNQIHNFISSFGSGTVINYGSGSGSNSKKVTVPTVPVPVPQRCLVVHEPFRSPTQEVLILLPHIAGQPGINQTQDIGQDHFLQGFGSAFLSSGSGSSILG